MTEETPADQCRTAAATLRSDVFDWADPQHCLHWLFELPDDVAESLAAILDLSATRLDLDSRWKICGESVHALTIARKVNGNKP